MLNFILSAFRRRATFAGITANFQNQIDALSKLAADNAAEAEAVRVKAATEMDLARAKYSAERSAAHELEAEATQAADLSQRITALTGINPRTALTNT